MAEEPNLDDVIQKLMKIIQESENKALKTIIKNDLKLIQKQSRLDEVEFDESDTPDDKLRKLMNRYLRAAAEDPYNLEKKISYFENWYDLHIEYEDENRKLIGFKAHQLKSHLESLYWETAKLKHSNNEKAEAGLVFARMAEKLGYVIGYINFRTYKDDLKMLQESLAEARKKEPENIGIYIAEAQIVQMNSNSFEELLDAFNTKIKKALEIDPNCPQVYSVAAKIKEKLCLIDEARKNYQKAIDLGLKDAKYELRGLENLQEHYRKEEQERKELDSNYMGPRGVAEAIMKQGRLKEAEEIYKALLEKFPSDSLTYLNLRDIYLIQNRWGDLDRIKQEFEKALKKENE